MASDSTNSRSEPNVPAKLKQALVGAFPNADEDNVVPNATLVGDLGAESIDFLDLVFRLEKAYRIEIPRSELFPEDILTSPEYVQDGRVTQAGVTELKERMPYVDLSKFEQNPLVQDLVNLLTVADLIRYLESKKVQLRPPYQRT